MRRNLLKEASSKIGRLIVEAERGSSEAYKEALGLVKQAIIDAFEDWEHFLVGTGRYEGKSFSTWTPENRTKLKPTEASVGAIKRTTSYIVAAFLNEDSVHWKEAHVGYQGWGPRAELSEDIRPEFRDIAAKWGTLNKLCHIAAKNAYWELYKKYKNAEGLDFGQPEVSNDLKMHRDWYLKAEENIKKYSDLLNTTPKGEKDKYGRSLRKVYYDALMKAKDDSKTWGERGGSTDWTKRWDKWKDSEGKLNHMLYKLDVFFKIKSQKGVWCGAYKQSFVDRVDVDSMGWMIERAIKDACAKLNKEAKKDWDFERQMEEEKWQAAAAETERWQREHRSSGNHMVDQDDYEARQQALRRRGYGRRY